MTERDTGATRRNPRPSGSPHMVMEAMACGCRLLDRSDENANCDTPTQGPSANPIRHSPMICATRPLSFLALFHPTHLAVHVSLLGFKLGQTRESIRLFLFAISFFPLSLFVSFFFFFDKGLRLRGRSRNVKLGRTRPDSTRFDPTLPGSPDGIRCE